MDVCKLFNVLSHILSSSTSCAIGTDRNLFIVYYWTRSILCTFILCFRLNVPDFFFLICPTHVFIEIIGVLFEIESPVMNVMCPEDEHVEKSMNFVPVLPRCKAMMIVWYSGAFMNGYMGLKLVQLYAMHDLLFIREREVHIVSKWAVNSRAISPVGLLAQSGLLLHYLFFWIL